MQHRIRVADGRSHIDFPRIWIDHDPRCSIRKASIGRRIPLHRCTGIIPAFAPDTPPCPVHPAAFCGLAQQVQAFYIPQLADVRKGTVGHADLLTLIQKWGSSQEIHGSGKTCGAPPSQRLCPRTAKPGDQARLIVIAPEQRVPPNGRLPCGDDLLEPHQVKGPRIPLGLAAVHVHDVKLEQHIQLPPVVYHGTGVLCGNKAGFPDTHTVPPVKALPSHFPQIVVQPGLERKILW